MSSKKRDKDPEGCSKSASKKQRNASSSSSFAWTPDGVQALLPAGHRLVFVGHAQLTIQSGEVDVDGHILTAASNAIDITTNDNFPLAIIAVSATVQIPLAGASTVSFSMTSPGGQNDFKVWADEDATAPDVRTLPLHWKEAANSIAASIAEGRAVGDPRPPIIAVCGAKKVGKSSFARYLVNVLLNCNSSVAYLDTDCGQPELNPPGLVALHVVSAPLLGPPHLHHAAPVASHFFGDVSPASDPMRYVCSIASLHRWYLERVVKKGSGGGNKGLLPPPPPPPLVVNTHGWVRGFGLDLLADVLRTLPITHYVHITASNANKDLPHGVFWRDADVADRMPCPLVYSLPGVGSDCFMTTKTTTDLQKSRLEAIALSPRPRDAPTAVDQRALHWQAFAQACIAQAASEGTNSHYQEQQQTRTHVFNDDVAAAGDALAAVPPMMIDVKELEMVSLHGTVPSSELMRAVNGAIVGLSVKRGPSPVSNVADPLHCLGIGIVRAVDADAGRVYLLTDVDLERLQGVNVLELGRLEVPPGMLQTSSFLSPYMALHSLATMGTGAGAMKSRNNLLRASQLA